MKSVQIQQQRHPISDIWKKKNIYVIRKIE